MSQSDNFPPKGENFHHQITMATIKIEPCTFEDSHDHNACAKYDMTESRNTSYETTLHFETNPNSAPTTAMAVHIKEEKPDDFMYKHGEQFHSEMQKCSDASPTAQFPVFFAGNTDATECDWAEEHAKGDGQVKVEKNVDDENGSMQTLVFQQNLEAVGQPTVTNGAQDQDAATYTQINAEEGGYEGSFAQELLSAPSAAKVNIFHADMLYNEHTKADKRLNVEIKQEPNDETTVQCVNILAPGAFTQARITDAGDQSLQRADSQILGQHNEGTQENDAMAALPSASECHVDNSPGLVAYGVVPKTQMCGLPVHSPDKTDIDCKNSSSTMPADSKPYHCTSCDKKFSVLHILEKHMRSHTREAPVRKAEKLHQCTMCERKFGRYYDLTRHIRTHSLTGEKPYQCLDCGTRFTRKYQLDLHAKKMYKGQKVCQYAIRGKDLADAQQGASSADKVNKLRTEILHSDGVDVKEMLNVEIKEEPDGEGVVQCESTPVHGTFLKDDVLETGDQLTQWTDSQDEPGHRDSPSLEINTLGAHCEAFQCDTDTADPTQAVAVPVTRPWKLPPQHQDKIDTDSGDLHARTVAESKPHQCTMCHKKFSLLHILERHMRIHTHEVPIRKVEKPHQCTTCDRKFGRYYDLTRHMKTHNLTGEKPYQCSDCGIRFTRKRKLDLHSKMVYRGQKLCQYANRGRDLADVHRDASSADEVSDLHTETVNTENVNVKETVNIKIKEEPDNENVVQCDSTACDTFLPSGDLDTDDQTMQRTDDQNEAGHCYTTSWQTSSPGAAQCDSDDADSDPGVIVPMKQPWKLTVCPQGQIDTNWHSRTPVEVKPYQCTICDKKFSLLHILERHMRVHRQEIPVRKVERAHQCTTCDRKFWRYYDLTRHMRTHTGEKPSTGEKICSKTDRGLMDGPSNDATKIQKRGDEVYPDNDKTKLHNTQADMEELSQIHTTDDHTQTSTNEKPYGCPICHRRFSQGYTRDRHMSTHRVEKLDDMDGKPYQCIPCDKRFIYQEQLALHNKQLHSENTLQDAGGVHNFMDVHNASEASAEAKPFQCTICEKNFTRSDLLLLHMKNHAGKQLYQCTVCEEKFAQIKALKIHTRFHDDKSFRCVECGEIFTKVNTVKLIRHMSTHTGVLPYQCSTCDQSFIDKRGLVRHVRTHTGENPYKCQVCEKVFTENCSLKVHMRLHTGERPYQCSECGKMCIDPSNLKKHMRKHTGEKPYKCTKCDKCFQRNAILKKHMKTHETDQQ